MADFIFELKGARGRTLKLYDNKVVIVTKLTAGSVLTGNATDGEKTIFLSDVIGVQFKKCGLLLGYLQFETPSMQMNNQKDNMFSENTFTFEKDVPNVLVEKIYSYVVDRLEEIKFGIKIIDEIPDFKIPDPNIPPQEHRYWTCPKCKRENDMSKEECWHCGNKRPD